MGHGNAHIEDQYNERLPEDDRLIGVSEHVRQWLYAQPQTATKLRVVAAG